MSEPASETLPDNPVVAVGSRSERVESWHRGAVSVFHDEDGNGEMKTDFLGRPHILIFDLGHGCLHCAEQLQAFGPQLDRFADAGIQFVAISSDDRDGLAKSIEQYGGDMPFEFLVSDQELTVFKEFRAFDDFENQPLHGTFLVDERGLIRWQDISYEPFMDHEFLFQEAQRLLKQSRPPRQVKGQAAR